jgi:hypothetical protein
VTQVAGISGFPAPSGWDGGVVVHPEHERVRPEPHVSASERGDVGRVGFAPWFRHDRTRSFELRGRRGTHPSAPGTSPTQATPRSALGDLFRRITRRDAMEGLPQ